MDASYQPDCGEADLILDMTPTRNHDSHPYPDISSLIARLLTQTVSEEVVPRLLLNHTREKRPVSPPALLPSARQVVELARLSVAPERRGAMRLVQSQLSRGVSLDSVCLDLLAPAARRLGALWLQDRCDFALVTIGTATLMHIHETITAGVEVAAGPASRRILLTPAPGEQHGFGSAMLAGFFRRAGWSVAADSFATERDLVAAVRRDSFDVIGLSVSCIERLDGLGLLLLRLRRASRHRGVRVMLGGPALIERPEAAALLGADASGDDARDTVILAGKLTSLSERAGFDRAGLESAASEHIGR